MDKIYNDKNTIITCRYESPIDLKLYSGKISYRNGTLINFETKNYELSLSENDNLLCHSDDYGYLILWNNKYFNNGLYITAGFDCLIKGLDKIINPNDLKFKRIRFSFPYINDFFIGVDRIEQFDPKNPKEIFLKYVQTKKKITYKLSDNFKFNLIHGVTYGGGTFGGENSKMSLTKEIEIIANNQASLDDFIAIIRNLMSFFSLGLKKKLPIINMYSSIDSNTAKCKLEIYPFQYKILNQDFETKIMLDKTLFTFPHIKKNFSEIIQQFMFLRSKDYRKFSVIIDLYLRNHDAPDEIYPQIKFLIFAQALEAYLNSKQYNYKKVENQEFLNAVQELKNRYPNNTDIQEIKCSNLPCFKEKILNSIIKNNLMNIMKFKFTKENKITLLDDLVNLRNYFTHYSMSSKDKRISSIDLYELTTCIKALLEIFLLCDLKFNVNAIKNIVLKSYFQFRNFNNKYIWICKTPNMRNLENAQYLGEDNACRNKSGKLMFSVHYYYKELENTVKLIIKYSEEGRYTRQNGCKLKILTDSILVNKKIKPEQLKNLDKCFLKCYERYKNYSQQVLFENDFTKNQTNLLQEHQVQQQI